MSYIVYLDTSVICCLSDSPSADPIARACQQLTRQWWATRCVPELTYTSSYVKEEIKNGDPLLAVTRLDLITQLQEVAETEWAISKIAFNAELLIIGGALKATAFASAKHIACAAFHDIDVLATWNCVDIANPAHIRPLRMLIEGQERTLPELVTPFQLMEHRYENR